MLIIVYYNNPTCSIDYNAEKAEIFRLSFVSLS